MPKAKVKKSDRRPNQQALDDQAWLQDLEWIAKLDPEEIFPKNENANAKTQKISKEFEGKLKEGINNLEVYSPTPNFLIVSFCNIDTTNSNFPSVKWREVRIPYKFQSNKATTNQSPAEEAEKTGLNQRYPIDAEEFRNWAARWEKKILKPCCLNDNWKLFGSVNVP